MGVLERLAKVAREGISDLRSFGRAKKPLAELSDSELEDELLRRRRERAARRDAGEPYPEVPRAEPPKPRSVKEQQLAQYYANLELPVGASLDEVRRAYRELMKRFHPDKHLGDPERHRAATELAQSLTRAYQALVDHLSTKGS